MDSTAHRNAAEPNLDAAQPNLAEPNSDAAPEAAGTQFGCGCGFYLSQIERKVTMTGKTFLEEEINSGAIPTSLKVSAFFPQPFFTLHHVGSMGELVDGNTWQVSPKPPPEPSGT